MKSKCKLLLSTITAATILAGSLSLPHPVNVQAALNPLTYLELSNGEVTGTTVKLRGWALNESGILEVDVYVDGKYVKCLHVDKERDDVNKAYPGYKDGDVSGYEDSIQVTPGKHTIRAYAIGNNRQVVYKEVTIDAECKDAKTCLELYDVQTIKGVVDIRGWSVNPSVTKYVDIYIDDHFFKTITPNEARPDVAKVFPQYANQPNCGFNYKLKLPTGYHKIRVYGIGNDGTNSYASAYIQCTNSLEPKMNIELQNNQEVGSVVYVRGWAVSLSQIKEVDIYIDGKYVRGIGPDYFEVRPDVAKAFPQYDDTESENKYGFQYRDTLSVGKHNIKAYVMGGDNDQVITSEEVNVVRKY